MSDIIKLLPDSVANQIAAGEVIQRPASVVKELVENAIDAGATDIKVNIKKAGKELIQVIDNGKGMSATDARLSFERHATSKIQKADDLFEIKTMGFRGEALASIAAIAQVELKTKTQTDELGTHIVISGAQIEKQDFINCEQGSNFIVKNLFFNIPARRRFLKADSTEFRHILIQFQRIVLCNTNIKFSLSHNNNLTYQLPISNHQRRIVNIFGNNIASNLIPVKVKTQLVSINGYVGKPEKATKQNYNQYFFVNQRFMKHPYFHKALMIAYSHILASNTQPSYFLFFDIKPDKIDVNVHPSKTEIKFEDAPAIFQIIQAGVKEALGKFNIVPSIDFDQNGAIPMPRPTAQTNFNSPRAGINPNYNPFEAYNDNNNNEEDKQYTNHWNYKNDNTAPPENWQSLYAGLDSQNTITDTQTSIKHIENESINKQSSNLFLLKNKYIVTTVKSGLMLINIFRAKELILYEEFIKSIDNQKVISQTNLFPVTLNLDTHDFEVLNEIKEDLHKIGFDIQHFGNNSYVINSTPVVFENLDIEALIKHFLELYKSTEGDIKQNAKEKIALSMAKTAAISYNLQLSEVEMQSIIDNLFSCSTPNYTQDGRTIIHILKMEDIDKFFKK